MQARSDASGTPLVHMSGFVQAPLTPAAQDVSQVKGVLVSVISRAPSEEESSGWASSSAPERFSRLAPVPPALLSQSEPFGAKFSAPLVSYTSKLMQIDRE